VAKAAAPDQAATVCRVLGSGAIVAGGLADDKKPPPFSASTGTEPTAAQANAAQANAAQANAAQANAAQANAAQVKRPAAPEGCRPQSAYVLISEPR